MNGSTNANSLFLSFHPKKKYCGLRYKNKFKCFLEEKKYIKVNSLKFTGALSCVMIKIPPLVVRQLQSVQRLEKPQVLRPKDKTRPGPNSNFQLHCLGGVKREVINT